MNKFIQHTVCEKEKSFKSSKTATSSDLILNIEEIFINP